MLNLIKMMALLFVMLAVTACDNDKCYLKSHNDNKARIMVDCYRSSKKECLQYLDDHCNHAEVYSFDEFSSGRLSIFAYCQE